MLRVHGDSQVTHFHPVRALLCLSALCRRDHGGGQAVPDVSASCHDVHQGVRVRRENGEGEESGVVDHSITLTCDFYIPDSYVGRMICHGEVQICIERGVGISSNLMLSQYG